MHPAALRAPVVSDRRAIVATVSRCAICDFIGPWAKFGSATMSNGLILVGGGNENWGMFSESVANRSVQWGIFENKLKSCGKTIADFHSFMNDDRILLWVTNQHHALKAVHPKVLLFAPVARVSSEPSPHTRPAFVLSQPHFSLSRSFSLFLSLSLSLSLSMAVLRRSSRFPSE